MAPPKPVVLCILDGWGLNPSPEANAVALAKTPVFDRLMRDYPNATLITHGTDVGLPLGQMGNSEVGHMNIGAGRIVEMDLCRINRIIAEGRLGTLPVIQSCIENLKSSGHTLHVAGLLSDGGVHSHIEHMIAVAHVFAGAGISVRLHLFGDGRDVAPQSAQNYLKILEGQLPEQVEIATLSGRYYAMDRDHRWTRIKQAYCAIALAEGSRWKTTADMIAAQYEKGITDEFFQPGVMGAYQGIQNKDAFICLNFRADRAREILSALADPDFTAFDITDRPKLSHMSGFTKYSDTHNTFIESIFPNADIKNTLGEWIAHNGLKQFRIAETEKYPHVTFFLNGGIEASFPGEDRYLAPSPKVATYDLRPEMSAKDVTIELVKAIQTQRHDLIVVNYANPDMVGHTGDLKAAIMACHAVDTGLGQALEAVEMCGGAMIVCADHGNCEMMIDPESGGAHTAHTTNPVPVILIGGSKCATLRKGGRLADLAPTVLDIMGLEKPANMTGETLICKTV